MRCAYSLPAVRFIGSHLTDAFLACGAEVTVADDFIGAARPAR